MQIKIKLHDELDTPEGVFSIELTGVDHSSLINHINKKLQSTPWAWATVEVQAWSNGVQLGGAFLGCCSYDNEQDFIKNSGYFEDMRASAIAEAKETLEGINKDLMGVS